MVIGVEFKSGDTARDILSFSLARSYDTQDPDTVAGLVRIKLVKGFLTVEDIIGIRQLTVNRRRNLYVHVQEI